MNEWCVTTTPDPLIAWAIEGEPLLRWAVSSTGVLHALDDHGRPPCGLRSVDRRSIVAAPQSSVRARCAICLREVLS